VTGIRRSCIALLGVLSLSANPAQAQSMADLRCRLTPGDWQRCRMVLATNGLAWTLLIGPQTVEFRHDGHGQITMRRTPDGWRAVEARWSADASLCWDGICARGPIPLD
jgi:hypothetical protein